MPLDSRTFLTPAQAVDAIAADFSQYGPQPELFRRITPLILGGNPVPGNSDGDTFGFYLIHMLETREMDEARLARICALVFETPAEPGESHEKPGIWIKNQMAEFTCTRCGNCCQGLEHVCAQEDLSLWKRLGRDDILSWVKKENAGGGHQYRIWINPNTGRPAPTCPFLIPKPGKDICHCGIQAVKPLVCREYPFTKKHARLTGCPGFNHAYGE